MTTARPPGSPADTERTLRQRLRSAGIVLSTVVLTLCNLMALFLAAQGWLVVPTGPGDINYIEAAWFPAFFGSVLAVLTAVLTVITVLLRWVRARWLLVPLVIFTVATIRWMHIDHLYPPQDYPDGAERQSTSERTDPGPATEPLTLLV